MGCLNADDLWTSAIQALGPETGTGSTRLWMEGIRPIRLDGDTLEVAAPSAFAKEWFETRYSQSVVQTLRAISTHDVNLRIVVQEFDEDDTDDDGIGEEPDEPQFPVTAAAPPPTLNPRYLFETFVIGPSNSYAHAAAMAVAEQPARSYNPLFISGGAGLGKTHLLHAIGHETYRLYPQAIVRYVSSEQFMNDFIQCVREDKMSSFRRRYREADLLLVDDIQFLSRGEQTQEEFFHTFNALHNDGRQIVITSDRPPGKIPTLEERLRTRFEWGLIVDVTPPDLETRVAILQKKAANEGFQVPNEILAYIATRVRNNIRELEGRLIRVVSFATLSNRPLTLELAQEVLQPLFPADDASDVPVEAIISACCEYFGIPREQLLSKSRSRPLTHARQIAMYLCRDLTPMSFPKIGEAFGRDHSTALHAAGKIREQMRERRATYQQVQELTAQIRGGGNHVVSL